MIDEMPESLRNTIGFSNYDNCLLNPTTQSNVNAAVQPYVDLLSGAANPEATAMVHLVGGVCGNSCGADVAHGYKELVHQLGGQIADVCDKDQGYAIQAIINDIVVSASPIKLDYVPISVSLAVALNGKEVKRSRTKGFDYHSSANSPVFINVKYKKGSEVVAAYKRWSQ